MQASALDVHAGTSDSDSDTGYSSFGDDEDEDEHAGGKAGEGGESSPNAAAFATTPVPDKASGRDTTQIGVEETKQGHVALPTSNGSTPQPEAQHAIADANVGEAHEMECVGGRFPHDFWLPDLHFEGSPSDNGRRLHHQVRLMDAIVGLKVSVECHSWPVEPGAARHPRNPARVVVQLVRDEGVVCDTSEPLGTIRSGDEPYHVHRSMDEMNDVLLESEPGDVLRFVVDTGGVACGVALTEFHVSLECEADEVASEGKNKDGPAHDSHMAQQPDDTSGDAKQQAARDRDGDLPCVGGRYRHDFAIPDAEIVGSDANRGGKQLLYQVRLMDGMIGLKAAVLCCSTNGCVKGRAGGGRVKVQLLRRGKVLCKTLEPVGRVPGEPRVVRREMGEDNEVLLESEEGDVLRFIADAHGMGHCLSFSRFHVWIEFENDT